ncbi:PDR/VanB family oxidoreductase [Raineyella fluvialis]|uniref:2Fe-2S iron-sulfur cluster binding domain-containing protein n=1 Tax=Raineyella fluvialis TaxID=2662261 RepID=A0A5Q2FCD4_9ACTN|nr:PDR/VanB family oxidoreductase [Raineyella fluvialis]QGF24051.1 2Fe-2S iron-sulfur cluster binding domain-containing protein [Raineyella fluvialis]
MADSLTLTVAAVKEAAPGIRTLVLRAPGGGTLPSFVAGSHLVLSCGARSNAYSLISDGIDPEEYRVSVLLVPDGEGGSRWVHESLAVGDTVTALLPRSAFAPIAGARKHLLIAAGIGITPILSHLRSARRWGRDVQVLYVHGGAGAHIDDVLTLTDGAAEVVVGRQAFAPRLAAALADQPFGTHLYVCGPSSFLDDTLAGARAAGWPASRLHAEHFGVAALDPGDPFRVRLTASGRTVDVPAGVSLLDALDQQGIAVPHLCRQGVCGECRLPVTAGVPLHRDLFLSSDEKEAGDTLMCCVSRALSPTLEVPL